MDYVSHIMKNVSKQNQPMFALVVVGLLVLPITICIIAWSYTQSYEVAEAAFWSQYLLDMSVWLIGFEIKSWRPLGESQWDHTVAWLRGITLVASVIGSFFIIRHFLALL